MSPERCTIPGSAALVSIATKLHQRPDAAPDSPVMLHLATRVTCEVFSFLGPATAALAEQGMRQSVIVLDDDPTRAMLERFDRAVELHRIPRSSFPLADLWRLRKELIRVVHARQSLAGIHLHGVLPYLLGASVPRSLGRDIPVCFSPHASKVLARLRPASRLLAWLLRRSVGRTREHAIASLTTDATRLKTVTGIQADVVESPVPRHFFSSTRHESRRPLIVGGGRVPSGAEALDTFVQFAVLLGHTNADPEFVWLGDADNEQRLRLQAAKVRWVPFEDDAQRAQVLSNAWVYVAPRGGRGVPVGLTEALASGVPCVAADTLFHRDVVVDGTTGLFYRRTDEALEKVARLIESPALRQELGHAARAHALQRFQTTGFRGRLLCAYRHLDLLGDAPDGELAASAASTPQVDPPRPIEQSVARATSRIGVLKPDRTRTAA
jgi:glycosyltransferase involved in cell wall biosynthesis